MTMPVESFPAQPLLTIAAEIPLGEAGRVIKFMGYIDADCPQEDLDAVCDKMVRAGNRQRAKNILPGLHRQLDDIEARIADNRKRLAGKKAERAEAVKQIGERVSKLEVERQSVYDAGYEAHVESGRRGAYNPDGALRSRLKNLDESAKQVTDAGKAADADYQRQIGEIEGELQSREYGEPARDHLRRVIAECEEAAAGSAPAE